MGEKERPKRQALKKDQCAYCKEWGHCKNECPKRDLRRGTTQREGHIDSNSGFTPPTPSKGF